MYQKYYVKQILLGVILAVLLGSTMIFGYSTLMELKTEEQTLPPWDMSSGISLSQEFANRGTDLFAFKLSITHTEYLPDCQTGIDGEEFNHCSVDLPLIETDTGNYHKISSFFANNTLEWQVEFRNDTDSYEDQLRSLSLIDLTNAIEEDAKSLDNITEQTDSEHREKFFDEMKKGNTTHLQVTIIYRDGTYLDMNVYDDRNSTNGDDQLDVYFSLRSFSSYYGAYYDDNSENRLKWEYGIEPLNDEEFYHAILTGELMPNLLMASGELIQDLQGA